MMAMKLQASQYRRSLAFAGVIPSLLHKSGRFHAASHRTLDAKKIIERRQGSPATKYAKRRRDLHRDWMATRIGRDFSGYKDALAEGIPRVLKRFRREDALYRLPVNDFIHVEVVSAVDIDALKATFDRSNRAIFPPEHIIDRSRYALSNGRRVWGRLMAIWGRDEDVGDAATAAEIAQGPRLFQRLITKLSRHFRVVLHRLHPPHQRRGDFCRGVLTRLDGWLAIAFKKQGAEAPSQRALAIHRLINGLQESNERVRRFHERVHRYVGAL